MPSLRTDTGLPRIRPLADDHTTAQPSQRPAGEPGDALDGLPLWVRHRLAELSEENAQLKQAIKTRPVVDQARGVLMAALDGDADDAWQVLRKTSQHANVPLRDVAASVVSSTGGTPIREDLRVPMREAIRQVWGQRDDAGRQRTAPAA
ncbi:ANTAR domain-containing protein [Streptomyces sp. 184]|uniref:ANTAR domain-containing protein n=1 Tax=Streptomyces sp. 184 TaxID=1827526 RepID=UPI00389285A3